MHEPESTHSFLLSVCARNTLQCNVHHIVDCSALWSSSLFSTIYSSPYMPPCNHENQVKRGVVPPCPASYSRKIYGSGPRFMSQDDGSDSEPELVVQPRGHWDKALTVRGSICNFFYSLFPTKSVIHSVSCIFCCLRISLRLQEEMDDTECLLVHNPL